MSMLRCCCLLLLLTAILVADDNEPSAKRPVNRLAPVVVTATKKEIAADRYPGSISVIDREAIETQPHQKVDELLQRLPGINVQRNSISDMRPVVGMRGLGSFEQGRVLVLQDGVPLNKTDNGDVNWNSLLSDNLARIEVLRGPGSAMYGSYAMGGVINLITRRPAAGVHGSGTLFGGSHDTWGNRFNLSAAADATRGWWFDCTGMYLDTNGHEGMSDYNRARLASPAEDETSLYLTEWSVMPRFGYSFDEHSGVDFAYRHYYDRRSEGRRGDNDSSGEYRHFTTDFYKARVYGGDDIVHWEASVFHQLEHYYKLYDRPAPRPDTDVDSDRRDYGLLSHVSWWTSPGNLLVFGFDYKEGSVEAQDIDEPGPGYIKNEGDMRFYGLYVQDTWFADDNFELNLGLRWDYAKFYDGAMSSDPGHLFAGYIAANPPADRSWHAWSPRLAARWHFNPQLSSYVSYARGFRAPELDDLCRTGWQYVGPKIANPELDPETIDTVELGTDWKPAPDTKTGFAVFYSRGRDFLYYIDTGIPVAAMGYWATRNYQIKQNVSEVQIFGFELSWQRTWRRNLDLYANYSFTRSEILEYDIPNFAGAADLEGRELRNAPRHCGNLGCNWRNPWVNTNLNLTIKGKYYTDDINSTDYETNTYVLVDVKFWKELGENFTVSLDIHNLLDDDDTNTATGSELAGGVPYDLTAHNAGRQFRAAVEYRF